jgi:hypothetical protein
LFLLLSVIDTNHPLLRDPQSDLASDQDLDKDDLYELYKQYCPPPYEVYPVGQFLYVVDPNGQKYPAGHDLQCNPDNVVAPVTFEYDPAGHTLQCSSDKDLAPVTFEYDPAGQGVYVLAPDGQK